MYDCTWKTGRASLYLLLSSRKLNPALAEVDWHTFLRENRRNPASNSAVAARAPRGNSHIYGRIPHISGGGRVLYSKASLLAFLKKLQDNPGLVERLVKQVEG